MDAEDPPLRFAVGAAVLPHGACRIRGPARHLGGVGGCL